MGYKKHLHFKLLFLILLSIIVAMFVGLQFLLKEKENNLSENSIVTSTPAQISNIYKTFNYKLEYPKDWNYDRFNTISGDSIIFKPKENTSGNFYPSISVSTTRDSKTDIERKESIFLMYGFSKTELLINNRIFTKLSGTYPYKTVSGKSVNSPVQETILLTKENNIEFLIKYQYEGTNVNQELEKKFNDIISTFQFL